MLWVRFAGIGRVARRWQQPISRGETRSRSETWTSLLSALVGAIVGGLASLGGTMLVNRQRTGWTAHPI
jgi:hypothetical protein